MCYTEYSLRENVWWLIWNASVRHVVAKGDLSVFRPVVQSLTMYAKRRVVMRHVVAMSHCRSAQIEGLTYKPSDRMTSGQHAARQRTVWRTSLETGRQDDSSTTRRLARFASDKTTRRKWDYDIGCVVAIDNVTRKVYQISNRKNIIM
jgi:hypothetical protein